MRRQPVPGEGDSAGRCGGYVSADLPNNRCRWCMCRSCRRSRTTRARPPAHPGTTARGGVLEPDQLRGEPSGLHFGSPIRCRTAELGGGQSGDRQGQRRKRDLRDLPAKREAGPGRTDRGDRKGERLEHPPRRGQDESDSPEDTLGPREGDEPGLGQCHQRERRHPGRAVLLQQSIRSPRFPAQPGPGIVPSHPGQRHGPDGAKRAELHNPVFRTGRCLQALIAQYKKFGWKWNAANQFPTGQALSATSRRRMIRRWLTARPLP